MRVIGIDPGAERLGWAVIESGDPLKEVAVGIYGLKRHDNGSKEKKEPYQAYRLRLIEFWNKTAPVLFDKYEPEQLYNEILPSVGGGNFVVAVQSQLAATALTIIQSEAMRRNIPVSQIGATTIKKQIGGKGKSTKVQVRNGVYELLPSTKRFKDEWVKIHDASDACAVALSGLKAKRI
jgi:Holliday junction resolvasome RuvABC endonuclease subunit